MGASKLLHAFLAVAMDALLSERKGTSKVKAATVAIARYPIKAIAIFLMAPVLALRVAMTARNPVRRIIAGVGLLVAFALVWIAGTFLGSVVGALFVVSHVGILVGLGFLIGSFVSVILSGAFCVIVFNATCWLFLNMSTEHVIDALNEKSAP